MSGPTGGRNSKAPTPEHPTPCVASKLCPTRADWVITHRNIQRHGDDPKLYNKSFHMPEHPTPHMESVSHAGTSNAAKISENIKAHSNTLETFRDDHSGQAASIEERARDTFQNPYADYEQSGSTPEKTEPEAPSKGTIESFRAMPMEALVEEFRENHSYE
ncbi:hypothetical protein L3X38_038646 [Prunus dulcis]|uniref:Uncharacterized protein n=1 Tax=Prunus dulcis TaxID=3755 RepID=A0AAD4YSD6_PRUDU|nr:hypothetical protein L3X38_038646 [Prunus dulcis]